MFERNGFKIIREAIFDEVEHESMQKENYSKKEVKSIKTNSIGMILQKI